MLRDEIPQFFDERLRLSGPGIFIFYGAAFGENPLNYPNAPYKTEEWGAGWYNYDNMLTVGERDDNAPRQIADLVRDAYERLQRLLCNVKIA